MTDNNSNIPSPNLSTPQSPTPQEEGDEIVRHMAVESQLRGQESNLQELVSRTLASMQDDEDDSELQSLDKRKRNYARYLLYELAAVAIGLAVFFLKGLFNTDKIRKDHDVVTVAEKYETISVRGCSFNMVSVKGGTFTMGVNTHDGDEDNDEAPTQTVTLSDFNIGETEVTQGLWRAVMGELPIKPDGDNHPMKNVSWDDCIKFIKRLNQLTGHHFHLPSEAQWEYAAKGGCKSHDYKYSGSNNIDEVAWYSANSWDKGKDSPDFGNHAVGQLKPNELGLYDMSGNVWEWCQDIYTQYDGKPKTDPIATSDAGTFRVNRGGSWDYISDSARSANRRNRTPDFRNFNIGLRIAE